MSCAILHGAYLNGANLQGANLTDGRFKEITNSNQEVTELITAPEDDLRIRGALATTSDITCNKYSIHSKLIDGWPSGLERAIFLNPRFQEIMTRVYIVIVFVCG